MRPFFEYFSEPARAVVVAAREEAVASRSAQITTAHLLVALFRLEEGVVAEVLGPTDLSAELLRPMVQVVRAGEEAGEPLFSAGAKTSLGEATRLAAEQGKRYVSTEHVLLGLCDTADETLIQLTETAGLSLLELRREAVAVTSRSSDIEAWIWPWAAEDGPTTSDANT